MLVKQFEDLDAWKNAQDLAVGIYRTFGKNMDFSFRDQICRAAVSVSNNITEGFRRSSAKDFIRFLLYAVGSCNEVKSMLYLAYRLNYIDSKQRFHLLKQCKKTTKLIRGLIRYLRQ